MTTATIERINTGLSDSDRQASAEILQRSLADTVVLYIKTKKYHWNVIGPQFNELHAFFQTLYEMLDKSQDRLAERVRALGLRSIGTLREFLDTCRLKESPGDSPSPRQMISSLLEDNEAVCRTLRQDIESCSEEHHDEPTANMLTEILEEHERAAWMLRSYLEGEPIR